MTWLLVLLAWTACAVLVAPVVGRALAHGGRAPSAHRLPAGVPAPRAPLSQR